ncbi:hypothetical protein Acr_22g0007770 [Actinidia rufa]|uniref:Uncharacterized protein n=1 Tax=Actinidia rufa TaxID=165716 RepID=A0A7J0GKN3_9ERIC|nr:hypothetical protein Acr_22g0007770 [Actinidia rufa]
MSIPQKQKESQISSSRCDSSTPNKRQATRPRTRIGMLGASSSQQSADISSPDVSKFRPNFESEGWDHFAILEEIVCPELVREFCVNIHATDKDARTLKSYVQGMSLDFSISDICNIFLIQPLDPELVGFPYPSSTTRPSLNSLTYLMLAKEGFTHAIASNFPVDLSRLMFNLIIEASLDNSSRAFLPFGHLVIEFLTIHLIAPEPHETHLPVEVVPPPAATDIPSTSIAPPSSALAAFDPKYADVIVALFTHIDVIHKDLIKRISLVHEHVDLIVERQEHDIKAVRDTLSTLSQHHSEFITKVNDFINSIRRR